MKIDKLKTIVSKAITIKMEMQRLRVLSLDAQTVMQVLHR